MSGKKSANQRSLSVVPVHASNGISSSGQPIASSYTSLSPV